MAPGQGAGAGGSAARRQRSFLPDLVHRELACGLNPRLIQEEGAAEPIGALRAPLLLQNSARLTRSEGDEAWSPSYRSLCDKGLLDEAFQALLLLPRALVSSHMFYRLLKECVRKKDLLVGRRIHALVQERNGNELDCFFGKHLIRMYAACGSQTTVSHIAEARHTMSCGGFHMHHFST